MDQFTRVASVSDIEPGHMRTFLVDGRPVAVANVDGKFFATDDTCSHAQCSLGTEGALDGTTIICGCHGAMFDVTDGKVLSLPAVADVGSYTVKVEGGEIFIGSQNKKSQIK